VEDSLLVDEGCGFEEVVANGADAVEVEEGFFVFVEFVEVAVHEFEDKRHLLWVSQEYLPEGCTARPSASRCAGGSDSSTPLSPCPS
jgi:hypothetical protein